MDAKALTEQMLQYANRYRHTHEEVKEAIEKSYYLFNKEYHLSRGFWMRSAQH